MIFSDNRLCKAPLILGTTAAWLLCTTLAFAEASYSIASKDLPSGALLSKSNIKEVFEELPHPDGAISGCSILYGCKIYAPITKGKPITDSEVCAGRWNSSLEAKDEDPAWIKSQKAAERAIKAGDFETAEKECDNAISELEKLAQNNQKITDFTEMSHLLIPYTEVELASWRSERHKLSTLDQRTEVLAERAKKELSQSQRLLAAMKKLLPADNFYVISQSQDVQHKLEDLKKAEHLSNMAKSVTKATVAKPKSK